MAQDHFTITASREGNVRIVALSGEVDARAAQQLDGTLKSIGTDQPLHVLVDTTGLKFLHSRAIALLVQFHRHAEANGDGAYLSVCRIRCRNVLPTTWDSTS